MAVGEVLGSTVKWMEWGGVGKPTIACRLGLELGSKQF